MHLLKIEEYNFTHGEHFNNVTGEYFSLNPHTLGRPLTHDEMDYNLLYQKQTINGYRVVGSNTDLTLAFADLNMVLQFSQISNQDADWTRYSGAGLFNGQFVWVPTAIGAPATTTTTTTAAPTTTTTTTAAPTTTTSTTTTTTTAAPAVYSSLTATPSPADEGQNIIINLSGTNIPNGRTVGWTIAGVDANDISGSLTGTFTMNSNQAEYIITVTEDLITEGTETLTLTCAANDNAGTTCGLSVAININDTSLTPVTTTTTTTTTSTTTTTTTAAPIPTFALSNNGPKNEGGNLVWTLTTTNVPNGTVVPFTLSGPAQAGVDYSNSTPLEFDVQNNTATYLVTVFADNLTEGAETAVLTLAANDSAGNSTGSIASTAVINDTSLTPTTTTTTTAAPTYTVETLFNHSAATTYHEMQTPLGTDVGNSHTINNSGLAAGATMSHTVYLVADAGWEFDYSGLQVILGGSPINLNNQPAGVTITQQSATQIRIQRDYINIQANATSTMNIVAVPMDQIFDCNYAGLSITIPAGSVGATVTGTVTIDGQAASNVSFSPAQYQLGNQTYNVTFDIPAGFANSGQITCQSSASGTTTTTTTTTAAAENGYFFHLGTGAYPWEQQLISGTNFYYPNNNPETNFAPIFEDMLANPSGYPGFDPNDSFPTLVDGAVLNYPANANGNYYWLLLPDSYNIPDLTQNAKLSIDGAPDDICSEKGAMTINGIAYTLYKLNTVPTTAGISVTYNA